LSQPIFEVRRRAVELIVGVLVALLLEPPELVPYRRHRPGNPLITGDDDRRPAPA